MSFTVGLNHINCILKIVEIPDQVFHVKRPLKSRVYTSFKLIRGSLRSMFLLSHAKSIVLTSKNCMETTYFMKDTYLASIKSMCMSYIFFLLNQLKYHCFPKGSAYASLRYICIKTHVIRQSMEYQCWRVEGDWKYVFKEFNIAFGNVQGFLQIEVNGREGDNLAGKVWGHFIEEVLTLLMVLPLRQVHWIFRI